MGSHSGLLLCDWIKYLAALHPECARLLTFFAAASGFSDRRASLKALPIETLGASLVVGSRTIAAPCIAMKVLSHQLFCIQLGRSAQIQNDHTSTLYSVWSNQPLVFSMITPALCIQLGRSARIQEIPTITCSTCLFEPLPQIWLRFLSILRGQAVAAEHSNTWALWPSHRWIPSTVADFSSDTKYCSTYEPCAVWPRNSLTRHDSWCLNLVQSSQ